MEIRKLLSRLKIIFVSDLITNIVRFFMTDQSLVAVENKNNQAYFECNLFVAWNVKCVELLQYERKKTSVRNVAYRQLNCIRLNTMQWIYCTSTGFTCDATFQVSIHGYKCMVVIMISLNTELDGAAFFGTLWNAISHGITVKTCSDRPQKCTRNPSFSG